MHCDDFLRKVEWKWHVLEQKARLFWTCSHVLCTMFTWNIHHSRTIPIHRGGNDLVICVSWEREVLDLCRSCGCSLTEFDHEVDHVLPYGR